jgi:uncharacterized protein (DUF2336 family)
MTPPVTEEQRASPASPGAPTGGATVDGVLELAHDRSPEGRAALVAAVSEMFYGGERALDPSERRLMADILKRLIGEVEKSVRKDLAERLADRADAPSDVIWLLANDAAEIAYPVLSRSSLLSDDDLLHVVRKHTLEHRKAIARRNPVSERLSFALLAAREENVAAVLLANSNARIGDAAYTVLADMAQIYESLHTPLLRRSDLPLEVARKVYWLVSAALRQHLVARFHIDPATLDDAIEETVEAHTPWHRRGDIAPPPALAEAADDLVRNGGATAESLNQLIRNGQVDLFEVVLSRLLDLRLVAVRRILYEPGGTALAVALKAIQTPKPDLASIFIWSRQARPGDQSVDPTEVGRVLELYDRIQPSAAQWVLKRWQRDPDYLMALETLQSEGAA